MNLKPNKNLLKISLFLIVGLFTIRDFNLEANAGTSPGGISTGSGGEKVCAFGDDIDETKWKGPENDENAKVSCYYNFDNCKTTIPGIANVTLYCAPKISGYKELWNDVNLYDTTNNSVFYKCTGATQKTRSDFYTTGTPDIEIKSKWEGFPSTMFYNHVKSIDYKFDFTMGLALSCQKCGSNFSSSCNLPQSTIPTPRPTPGCSVTSSSQIGEECSIPKDCFNDSRQPTRVDGIGVYSGIVGGLYCINKGDGKRDKGNVHFCQGILQGSNYIVKAYTEISEIKTLNGVENVYFQSGGSTSCIDQQPTNFGSTNRKATLAADVSPIGLIKTLSNFLFYFAILYFVLLILSNGFAYVRAAEDPGKLKEIKASLFSTIAGFLFVLLSGGLIISLINQIGI